ncbi:MAG: isopenicillin N synthase family oxygenase [Mesorhizobium sp.]|uniref:isopenicillin N synthase family dioxygenase n=1 Tax=unclassified Mesorhizobium TaxID=325217 RepID=UPI000FCCCD41|nr:MULTISPECIES: 2-oxoglutarate and iron-dependent oxygenase domain-containing protein [unclassified Mesorhizobium]RUW33143.1 isopenicillin N synthase family oxygenase [Mesorhizobium sp. M2A.F.Ca.ET.015.02.1.1]RVC90677.1 isopenicillin N synthase family oxygenase [Mesorhizobium sp. M2A.F.Ca.ET.017.03.2.1]RVC93275.1 isopenicillin N synthase family oxygenase [Mesorhizobium sp. M2A.F.Ca.ET.029.05.1.1]RWC83338.1 MAG: isopenicillin N synthase family oxygenase [Mesorhizobium sp.]RWF48036.1 MAG: isope
MTALPQISLAKLAADATRHEERERLRLACEEYGFFYLEHGIPKEQIAEAIQASRRFFALPQATKERFGHSAQDVYPATARGYSPLYGEVLHPEAGPDPKEMFDLGIENEGDQRPFAGCTRLPDDAVAPGFARSLLALQATVVSEVVPKLGMALADLLEMEEGWFQRHFNPPTVLQRVIRYPSSGGTAGKHTDNGFFTLLLQEELPTRSLQVWLGGRWTPAPSFPDSLVVNLGDMLQALSDDRFKSTPHQVVHPGPAERISLPFFIYPDIDARLTSHQGKQTFSVVEMMLQNFDSIWETGNGAGRARELQ